MSSAVNKSSKRFVPKIGSRGSSIRAPVRRDTRRSFSVPSRVDSNASQTPSENPDVGAEPGNGAGQEVASQSKTRAELLGFSAEEIARGSGSAIDDALDEATRQSAPGESRASSTVKFVEPPSSAAEDKDSPVALSSAASRTPDPAPQGTQSTQATLVEQETIEGSQPNETQSTQVEPSVAKPAEHTPAQTPEVLKAGLSSSLAEEALPDEEATSQPAALPKQAPLAQVSHVAKPTPALTKPSLSRPPPPVQPVSQQPVRLSNLNAPRRSTVAASRPVSRPASSAPRSATASAPRAAKPVVPSTRPEAPPGCQIIEPEDLRDLKREERRRREAWENAQIKLMRELFVEKEHKRLMDEESYDETSSIRVAHATSETLTFNALKQAVMSELKEYKEKMEKEKAKEIEQQAKQKGGARNGSGASAATTTAVDTAASILEPETAPPLKQLINVEKFRMSDLCKDIPVGTPNEKYDDYENARVQRRRDRLLLLRAKNWKRNALKREPSEAEKAMLETVYAKFKNERLARSDKIKEESERKLKSLDDGTRVGPAPAPTLEIGQDGQIRIEHTQVDRHVHNRSNQSESAQNKVEVDETQKTINSYSFSTKERPERWSKEETQKFYEALSAWGTDFNLIAHLFPTRSRHQIKTKFKYEERRHSIKVQMYLVHRRKANVSSYAEVSDQQIEDVKDIEEALERVRDEHEERMKIEQTAREQARNEDQEKQEQQSPKRRQARDASLPAPKRERLR